MIKLTVKDAYQFENAEVENTLDALSKVVRMLPTTLRRAMARHIQEKFDRIHDGMGPYSDYNYSEEGSNHESFYIAKAK